jgi:hypothetical protein
MQKNRFFARAAAGARLSPSGHLLAHGVPLVLGAVLLDGAPQPLVFVRGPPTAARADTVLVVVLVLLLVSIVVIVPIVVVVVVVIRIVFVVLVVALGAALFQSRCRRRCGGGGGL